MNTSEVIAKHTNKQLLQGLSALGRKETAATVELLLYLAEVDKRKIYLGQGYSSLFDFCCRSTLRYSTGAAHRRISSCRLIARYPELIELLISKELNLCILSAISSILSDENKSEILAAVRGRSKREVDAYLSQQHPSRQRREKIRPVCVACADSPVMHQDDTPLFGVVTQPAERTDKITSTGGSAKEISTATMSLSNGGGELPTPAPGEQRYELNFTVSTEALGKFRQAQALLSNKHPGGPSAADVFEAALDAYLDKHSPQRRQQRRERRKNAAPAQVRRQSSSVSRHIPNQIRDRVFVRDRGQCAFVSEDGVRCACRHNLEVHHKEPFSRTQSHSLDNLSVRCRRHNLYEEELEFGVAHMSRFTGVDRPPPRLESAACDQMR